MLDPLSNVCIQKATVKIQCLGEHRSSDPRFLLIIVSVLEIKRQSL